MKSRIGSRSRIWTAVAAAGIAVLGLTGTGWANTAAEIRDIINATIDLNATVSGNTVTVAGTLGATPSTSNFLTFGINTGVTVVWQATLQGNPSSNFALVNINGGSGIFRMESGALTNNGTGMAISNNSVCAINIQGGTVSATSGVAIRNNSTGIITVSGSTTRITSANTSSSSGTIFLGNSGTEWVDRLIINGGAVENTVNNGNAVYNNSVGTVRVAGGTVSATTGSAIRSVTNYMNIGGSWGSYWGSVIVSSGEVRATTGITISGGAPTISGGTVSTTTGTAISTGNLGGFTISGGTVSATTGRAIQYNAAGTVTISGSATRVTSANTSSSSGTIYLGATGATLSINGGAVENTATGTNGNAIYIDGWVSGTVNVSGGTVSTTSGHAINAPTNLSHSHTINISSGTISASGSSGDAVWIQRGTVRITGGTVQGNRYAVNTSNNVSTILGGNPTITGRIWTHTDRFSVLTSGTDAFAPEVGRVYTLEFPLYEASRIAVTNGRDFIRNFTLFSSSWALTAVGAGAHLAIAVARTVTFNLNGGTGTAPASVGVADGNRLYVKPPTTGFTRPGYTNDGNWYTTTAGTTEFLFGDNGTPVMSNMTLYLRWTPTPYTITYNLNSGTNHPSNPVTYNITSPTITLQSPTRAGFVFDGWFTAQTGGTRVTSIPSGSTGDRAFWARWIQIYTVTFDANDGMVTLTSATTRADGTLASLPTPTRTGHFFEGWFTAVAGGTQVLASRVYSANTTIYAQWTPIYTVTFNPNGGTVIPTSGATSTGGRLASLPTPTRSGYSFIGWFTAEIGGTQVTATTAFSANAIIYARWALSTYTVTFNANSGTVTPTSGTTGAGWMLASLPVPTRIGYSFDGWFTMATDGTEVTTNTVFSANTTIFARWTLATYTITFNANGGMVTTTTGTTGTNWTLTSLPTPTRTGYTFDGWFTAEIGGTVVTTSTVFDTDTVIYARWTLNRYRVTFDASGGTVDPEFDSTGTGWTLASLPEPVRPGYAFNGWFTDVRAGEEVTAGTLFDADATVYAQWTVITYAVTFEAGVNGSLTASFDGGAIATGALVEHGGNVVFTAVPAEGYHVSGWMLDGVAVAGDTASIYTLTGISAAVSVMVSFAQNVSIMSSDREIPADRPNGEAAVIVPVVVLAGEFTAGPNPVARSLGVVNLYRQGRRVNSGVLTIYDASGNVVNRVNISDTLTDGGSQGRRIVGSWDLTDARGRPVSEGVYLVRGTITAAGGVRERVSVVVGVR
ncbi:MAG: InlB B-repeat-containing protein [Chitinispirillales bacterium]|jgi:uncharacterized repeat protein (TIGR02543 family)|nr:InlB B-repeat-containing protein [Chitinispirillales bacterium]